MSSTNRGAERQPDDFYATPAWCVDAILPYLDLRGTILDPSAGDGAIVRALLASGVDTCQITAVELDEGRAGDCASLGVRTFMGDYLVANVDIATTRSPSVDAELTIMNPPFSLAREFIDRALLSQGTVAALLRLNFLGGQTRAAWHRAHPADVYVLSRRPSFTASLRWKVRRCGLFVPTKNWQKKPVRCDREAEHDDSCIKIGTDSCDYAWFVWSRQATGRICVL